MQDTNGTWGIWMLKGISMHAQILPAHVLPTCSSQWKKCIACIKSPEMTCSPQTKTGTML